MRSSYQFGGDLGLGVPFTSIYNVFTIWNPYNYSGLISSGLNSSIILLYDFVILLFSGSSIVGIKYSSIINLVVFKVFGAIGMFLLVYYLSRTENIKIKVFSASVSAIIFIAIFGSFGASFTSILFMPLAVLFFYLFERSVINNKQNYVFLAASILSLSFTFAISGTGSLVQVLILVFVLMIALLFAGNRRTIFKQLTFGLFIIFISILIVLPLIFSSLISTSVLKSMEALFSINSNQDFVNYAFNIMQSFTQSLPFSFDIYTNLLGFAAALVSIFSILAVIILIFRERSGRDKIEIALIAGLVLTFILFIAISATTHKPFGALFSYLYKFIPYFVVFRYGSASSEEILFIISVLFGVGLSYSLSVIRGNGRTLFAVSILLVILFCGVFLYFNTFLPIVTNGVPWTNHLLPFISTIPKHVTDIAGYVNSNVSGYAVATLPSDDDWHISKWYNGTDIYSSIINAPVYTGGFTAYSEFFFPPSQHQYAIIAQPIQDTNSSMNISEALGVFGIKYIIVQGDTANIPFGPNHPLNSYKFSDIYHNLNSSSGIRFVKRFANSSIYINERAVPLVYPSDLIVSNDNRAGQIINLIADNGINVSRYSIYSDNVIGGILWYGDIPLFNSSNTINATPVNDFSDPGIRFVQNTPTKITVDVSNATTPYYLVFRETYDTHWVAYYSNGTAVPERDHIMVNGFANAWYIDRPGSYTITLYYTLQTETWIAWVISFAALFATFGIGIYGWRARGAPIQKRARVRKRG